MLDSLRFVILRFLLGGTMCDYARLCKTMFYIKQSQNLTKLIYRTSLVTKINDYHESCKHRAQLIHQIIHIGVSLDISDQVMVQTDLLKP